MCSVTWFADVQGSHIQLKIFSRNGLVRHGFPPAKQRSGPFVPIFTFLHQTSNFPPFAERSSDLIQVGSCIFCLFQVSVPVAGSAEHMFRLIMDHHSAPLWCAHCPGNVFCLEELRFLDAQILKSLACDSSWSDGRNDLCCGRSPSHFGDRTPNPNPNAAARLCADGAT